MQKIETKIMNIDELFTDKKYTIGYFQRGYSWKKAHVLDLINDLITEFHMYKENSDKPPTYFLGSIIVSGEDQALSLIDGQQRLTSLSLILIWIARECREVSADILPLIFKGEGDDEICTLHVEERTAIMKSLYKDEAFVSSDMSVSVKNINQRFGEIDTILLAKKISTSEMIEFVYWLKNHVCVAQIKTASEKDAYKIFESANDRGVKLSFVDMFKSYILSNVKPDEEKERLDKIWKARTTEISNISNVKESDTNAITNAIKYWLRSAYVKTSRDYDEIGGEFHRWIKTKVKNNDIGLKDPKDFSQFIEVSFQFYIRWYLQSSKLAKEFETGNEAIFCNQAHQYTFQHQIILSSLNPSDNDETVLKKIKLVSNFIDIFIARRLWNCKPVSHNSLEKDMRFVIENIRGKDLNKILPFLLDTLGDLEEEFHHYTMPVKNKYRIFLARFSAWLDTEMGSSTSKFASYTSSRDYDIEHIMPNNYAEYSDIVNEAIDEEEFSNEDDFQQCRNSFGAVLLLPPSFNRSYGALSYKAKLNHYINQDMILAKTLCKSAYDRNPKLNQMNDDYKIKFEPHDDFLKMQIGKRQKVYTRLAQIIWDSDNLRKIID